MSKSDLEMQPTPLLWYHFGPFRLCPAERLLLRENNAISLNPRTFDTLVCLVKNSPNLVTSADLVAAVWKASKVESANVAQQIYYARRALNDPARERKVEYIENVAQSGYRFVAKVEECWQPYTNGLREPGANAVEVPVQVISAAVPIRKRHLRWKLGVVAVIAAMVALAMAGRYFGTVEVKITGYKPLTDDGTRKIGPLLTDGQQIFYQESAEPGRIVTLPVSGGSAVAVPNIPAGSLQTDLSADGKLLFTQCDATGCKLWIHSLADGTSKQVGDYREGGWSPDGKTVAAAGIGSISIGEPGKTLKQISVRGSTANPHWAPDGRRIRFGLGMFDKSSLWEIGGDGSGLRPVSEFSEITPGAHDGVWRQDGQYFFFEAGTGPNNNIWVFREGIRPIAGLLRTKPVPFTNGPGSWRWPLPGKDSSTLFAIHRAPHAELAFWDAASHTWQVYWKGHSAFEMDFSRDGHWVTYASYPEHTLWKARPDGSEKCQLTGGQLEVHQPHWSPDGEQIAFMGRKDGGAWQVFVVRASGGNPDAVLPGGADQGVPTWAPDGKSVNFWRSPIR